MFVHVGALTVLYVTGQTGPCSFPRTHAHLSVFGYVFSDKKLILLSLSLSAENVRKVAALSEKRRVPLGETNIITSFWVEH